jgi:hypothetical protein
MTIQETAYKSICGKLFPAGSVNYEHVALAVAFQFIFGLLWFGLVFSRWYSRALAVEKGVTNIAYIIQRYSELIPSVFSFVCGAVRALAIIAFANAFKTCYCNAAGVVVAATLAALHHALWSQTMLVMTGLNVAYEVSVTFAAAWFLGFLKNNY